MPLDRLAIHLQFRGEQREHQAYPPLPPNRVRFAERTRAVRQSCLAERHTALEIATTRGYDRGTSITSRGQRRRAGAAVSRPRARFGPRRRERLPRWPLLDWKVVGIDCSKLIVKRGAALNAKFPHSAIRVSIEAGSPCCTMVSEFKRICPRPDARGRSMPQVS